MQVNQSENTILPYNKEVFDLWIAALRSGDFVQGTGRLCQTDGAGNKKYCCLGVLSHIHKDNEHNIDMSAFVGDNYWRQLGFDKIEPDQCVLANLNDNPKDRLTFPQIADWLEEKAKNVS